MKRNATTIGSWLVRIAHGAAALALAFAAHAAPAPGTVISNQATATASTPSVPLAPSSNTVTATVASGPPSSYAAVLAASTQTISKPGATVVIAHTLTNTGALTDAYTLAVTPTNNAVIATAQLFADADGNGKPDGPTPIGAAVTLNPGQVFRFVAVYAILPSAPLAATGNAKVSAASAGAAAIKPVNDAILLRDNTITLDCGRVTKMLSRERGPSPAGPVTVTLGYDSCDAARAKIVITDRLPAGMKYLPGTGRWTNAAGVPLTDAVVGNDLQGAGASQIAYDFNATTPGAVTFTVTNVPAGNAGYVTFDVEIAQGLAINTVVPNTADYAFYDAAGVRGIEGHSMTVTYTVTGRADFDLTGETLATVTPGTTAVFTNVLTNRGDTADTYDITLSNSTFPPGTTISLFQADGVTPLADTNGSGIPDTGVVPAGGTYKIVVKAVIPETAAPGAYKVTKTARSAANPLATASADDKVDTVATKCAITLDPDNNAQVGFGQHVTYTHFLTNRGNCSETVRALVEYLKDSRPGWTSRVYVDNKAAGAGSLPGVVDATDLRIQQGWTTTLAPAESLRILVDVLAPTADEAANAAKAGKAGKAAIGDSNLTTLVITTSANASLVVHDTTIVQGGDGPSTPVDVVRNFTDGTYNAPTAWGVVGGNLWLKADAPSCNAQPGVAESRTMVITGPGGEREEVTGVETGPNTGVFVASAFPVRAPPIAAGDHVIEGRANDVYDVQVIGCGRTIATAVTLMEPSSVVFDSRTNEPVANARVTLVTATGNQCSATPATITGPNPVTTGADGRFTFAALPAGQYCLAVAAPNGYRYPSTVQWPQLPAGRNLNVTGLASGGSYGNAFPIVPGGLLVIDLPLDPAAQDGLLVQKSASRAIAEVGEFVDYTVRVRNATGNALDRADVTLTDDLPAGFAYVRGSARRDGQTVADPANAGPRLTLVVGPLARDQEAAVTYRVRLGPGSLQGDGVNRVQARYEFGGSVTTSNVATARVQVTGGVFSDKGFVLGKVFMDCNANGVQDAGEAGVPDVRVLLEDGTYVITDGGGKFSFYGLAARTHVLKADRTTLPMGTRLVPIAARNLGDGGSRIVDLKAGELHRADFALAGCTPAVLDAIAKRAAAQNQDEFTTLVAAQLAVEARPIADVKALPASGVVQAPAATGLNGAAPITLPQGAPGATAPAATAAPAAAQAAPATAAPAPLEAVVPTLDNKLGFVGLADGQVLPVAQATVRVKGVAGATLSLSVNDAAVPESKVGKRAVLQDKQLQAWEYIGVDLRAGENTLTVAQKDAFGNARGSATITVIAPDKLGRVALELPAGAIADGKTAVKVVVRLTDARGTPVTGRTPVTLESSTGKWKTADLDLAEPGLQVMVEGGVGEAELIAPVEPGAAQLQAVAGGFRAEGRLDFLPELRDMVAGGVLEGIVNLRSIGRKSIVPTRDNDAFEQELRHLSREWDNGKTQAGARAAFYLKGRIKGDMLLTAAYDSDKDSKERLFRDIQPDEFYPVYGDSGTRGYDAQSTSKLYVRIDKNKSYLLWGDLTTASDAPARRLGNYSRSLTGAKYHYESGAVVANVFASRDTTRQVIDELRANGTSGPFTLTVPNALVNSEKVEILVRDRSQPAIVVKSTPQARFSDYEIDNVSGRILFKAPVPSLDEYLNPISIRVTYEVDQGGPEFWVAGGDVRLKVTDRIEVGASYVKDKNPLDPFEMKGAHTTLKLAESTTLTAEWAQTDRPLSPQANGGPTSGNAARIEVKHRGKAFDAEAFVAKSEAGFDNPGAYLSRGRSEAGAKILVPLGDKTRARVEALRTEDGVTNGRRDGVEAVVEHTFANGIRVEAGARHAKETNAPALPTYPNDLGTGSAGTTPNEVTSVRAKVTGPLPGVKDATVFLEGEADVSDFSRKMAAVGGEYQLPNKGRVYARHEFISSLTGPYGLNSQQRQNSTVVGVDTEYMKDGKLFSEYRIRDALSGGDTEAAIGLRNLWTLAPGLRLGTSIERIQAIAGKDDAESSAVALGLEYTANPLWKGTARLELRDGHSSDSVLSTLGFAAKVSKDWTVLARNTYSVTRNAGETGGRHAIERLQGGLAYRDSDTDKWNALARVEMRSESDTTQPAIELKSTTEIVSLHADWKPIRPFVLTGRYAAKWTADKSQGLSTKYRAQVVGGRATWEFLPKWDIGLVTSLMTGNTASSKQYGLGLELGYLLANNLWVSAGYNLMGYKDADLQGADYTAKGPYVRVRYKFDEQMFDRGAH